MTVLTFPTNPTLGQRYNAPNQIQYVYDGVKWIVETVASTSLAVTNSVQDRVAPMFVTGPHNGIAFTYNAGTNVISATVTAGGNSLVNGDSSFSMSSDGTLTLTHPAEPALHPLATVLTVQKAAGNYHTISGAYGLSLQATPVPSGSGLNTNTNFVDIFHDGISVNVDNNTWAFGTDGTTTFPTLTVPISDNATPSGTGQTLKFSDSSQQAIIFGPEALSLSNPSAQRIIIQGAPGFTGTTGEGGDVYLWAGPGGSLNGNGGDIKVRAGQGNGTGSGGYLNFQAGDSGTGNGGYINIESGNSNTYGSGGDITVQAKRGGEVYIRTYSNGGANNWLFGNNGVLTLPNNGTINDYVGSAGVLGIRIDRTFQTPDNTNSANFGTNTVKLLLSDVEAAEIVSYLTASIGVRVWFNQGDNYPITSCVQVSTGIWTVTATGMGNRFATFAASNTLIFIYTGATPNTYTNFPQYVPVGDGAGITISKGVNSWNFGTDGSLTLPDTGPILFGGNNCRIQAGQGFSISSDGGIRVEVANEQWLFGPAGTLAYPNTALQRDTATVICAGNASTVVYTASGFDQHTIRLLIQVEGNVGAAVDWDTQACEMIIAKSWRANDVASSVYGVVHTSVAPLATFTAEWNALTSRVEVLCATPSANTVYVRTFATEITTAD